MVAGTGKGKRARYTAGSGFIIDGQSHIITNNHVIQGRDKITVILADNRIESATVTGSDPETDIAVLQIEPRNLPTVRIGEPDELRVGEPVIAIGSAPDPQGGPTVSSGVVSAEHRAATEDAYLPEQQRGPRLYNLIQTDAAINPGNRGGPLLNMSGEVIGVNTLATTSTDSGVPVLGINFAVSIDTAMKVANELIANGKMVYPYIGILTSFLYPDTAVINDVEYVPGQLIAAINPGTPASRSGLRKGDIITEIEGHRIENESAFTSMLRAHKPGDTITLTVRRDNRRIDIRVTLAKRPPNLL